MAVLLKDSSNLIVERPSGSLICIEIKSTEDSTHVNTSNLGNLANDLKCIDRFCFSQDPVSRNEGSVCYIHWQNGIEQIFKENFKSTSAQQ